MPLSAKLDMATITNLVMTKTLMFIGGSVPLTISGNSSVYDGQNIPYYTRALSANSFTVNLNIGSALSQFGSGLFGPP